MLLRFYYFTVWSSLLDKETFAVSATYSVKGYSLINYNQTVVVILFCRPDKRTINPSLDSIKLTLFQLP